MKCMELLFILLNKLNKSLKIIVLDNMNLQGVLLNMLQLHIVSVIKHIDNNVCFHWKHQSSQSVLLGRSKLKEICVDTVCDKSHNTILPVSIRLL